MILLASYLLVVLGLGAAVVVATTKDLVVASFGVGAVGLVASFVFLLLHAPDVAMAEAAIGSGLTTILLLATVARTRRYVHE